MSWSDLSMAERAEYIRLGVQNGVTNLKHIRDTYNTYALGGHIYDGTKEKTNLMDIAVSTPKFSSEEKTDNTRVSSPMILSPKSFIIPSEARRETVRESRENERRYIAQSVDNTKETKEESRVNRYLTKRQKEEDARPRAYIKDGTYVDQFGKPISSEDIDRYYKLKVNYKDRSKYNKYGTKKSTVSDFDPADRNDARRQEVEEGDRYASQFTAPALLGAAASGVTFLSPSQQFGAISDKIAGRKGYWESIGGGNSGFFTPEYAEEHPIGTTLGNIGIDMGLGATGLDAIEILTRTPLKLSTTIASGSGKTRLIDKPIPEIQKSLNNKAESFYQTNIKPKLESLGDNLSLPYLFHDESYGNFNNLPITVKDVISKDKQVSGYHVRSTGENVVKKKRSMPYAGIHEAASHGTDKLIPKKVRNFYTKTIETLPNKNKLLRRIQWFKPSNKWYELRATKNELEYHFKRLGLNIDDITDEQLVDLLSRKNLYGKEYAKGIKNPSKILEDSFGDINTYTGISSSTKETYRRSKNPFLDRLRYSIKYLPAIGASTYIASNS